MTGSFIYIVIYLFFAGLRLKLLIYVSFIYLLINFFFPYGDSFFFNILAKVEFSSIVSFLTKVMDTFKQKVWKKNWF